MLRLAAAVSVVLRARRKLVQQAAERAHAWRWSIVVPWNALLDAVGVAEPSMFTLYFCVVAALAAGSLIKIAGSLEIGQDTRKAPAKDLELACGSCTREKSSASDIGLIVLNLLVLLIFTWRLRGCVVGNRERAHVDTGESSVRGVS